MEYKISFAKLNNELCKIVNNPHTIEEGTSDKLADVKANKGSTSNFLKGDYARDDVKCDKYYFYKHAFSRYSLASYKLHLVKTE